jgi:hypothetical protein
MIRPPFAVPALRGYEYVSQAEHPDHDSPRRFQPCEQFGNSRRTKYRMMKYVFSAVTLLAMAAFVARPAGAYPEPTQIVTYKAASMKAAGKAVRGYCWTSSIASLRSDAFRCMIGNSIMDPCFSVSSKVVNCPENMSANTGTVIDLTQPLPENNLGHGGAPPWTYQAAGGKGITCNVSTGTAPTDSGDYRYYCTGDLVCTVPKASARMPGAYLVTCGTRTLRGSVRTVKDARMLFVVTMWQ